MGGLKDCPILISFSGFWQEVKQTFKKDFEGLNYVSLVPVIKFGEVTPRTLLKVSKAVRRWSWSIMDMSCI